MRNFALCVRNFALCVKLCAVSEKLCAVCEKLCAEPYFCSSKKEGGAGHMPHMQGRPEPFICIYGVYTVFRQENHQIYGHIRCTYTVLANPTHVTWHICDLDCLGCLLDKMFSIEGQTVITAHCVNLHACTHLCQI